MKERPILFSAPMVRALLDGSKTQTRRAIKPQPDTRPGMNCTRLVFKDRKGQPLLDEALEACEPRLCVSLCPYGEAGDRLWVREGYSGHFGLTGVPPRDWMPGAPIWYWADGNPEQGDWTKPKPGMHMPRWASRILLEITDVRVERLQDISEADAVAEGCALECMTPTGDDMGSAIHNPGGYLALWESINGTGAWDANPWVWVVSFKKVTS